MGYLDFPVECDTCGKTEFEVLPSSRDVVIVRCKACGSIHSEDADVPKLRCARSREEWDY